MITRTELKEHFCKVFKVFGATTLWQLCASYGIDKIPIDPYGKVTSYDMLKLSPIVAVGSSVPDIGAFVFSLCQKSTPGHKELKNRDCVAKFNDILTNFFSAGFWQIFYNIAKRYISKRFFLNASSVGLFSGTVAGLTEMIFLTIVCRRHPELVDDADFYKNRAKTFILSFCVAMWFVLTDIPELTDFFLSSCLPDNEKDCSPIMDAGKAGITGLMGMASYYLFLFIIYLGVIFYRFGIAPCFGRIKRWHDGSGGRYDLVKTYPEEAV